MSLKTIIDTEIEASKLELADISKTIFDNPELNYEEKTAHRCLTDFLESRGFLVERNCVVETAFRATYDNFGGKQNTGDPANVAILCEYDALPGIGHACGHNLIAEIGVGAALGVKAALDNSPSIKGKLMVLGCPAEEGGGGKLRLIKAGVFQGVDVAMMSHPSVANISKPKLPAIQCLTATFTGSPSHACTGPWEGRNALDAVVLAYQGLSVLRQQCKPDWRISAIITKGGAEVSIITQLAEMRVSYRALTVSDHLALGRKVNDCLEAAASATSCPVRIEKDEDSYMSMLHNRSMAALYETHCEGLGLDMCKDADQLNALVFSTDMGDVSHVVPSIHPVYRIGTDAPNHTEIFAQFAGSSGAQHSTLLQAKALALTAMDIIQTETLRQQIRTEFKENIQHK